MADEWWHRTSYCELPDIAFAKPSFSLDLPPLPVQSSIPAVSFSEDSFFSAPPPPAAAARLSAAIQQALVAQKSLFDLLCSSSPFSSTPWDLNITPFNPPPLLSSSTPPSTP